MISRDRSEPKGTTRFGKRISWSFDFDFERRGRRDGLLLAVYAFHLLGKLAPAFGEFKKGSSRSVICRPLCGVQAFE
jgi:hypothetical protein